MPVVAKGRLTNAQLDSIEKWAQVLIDEGDREAGEDLLSLLKERSELGELVRRDEDGQLGLLVDAQKLVEKYEEELPILRQAMLQARHDAEQERMQAQAYREENMALRRKLDTFEALIHKVEKLLAMARSRLKDGDEPSDLAKLAEGVIRREKAV